MCRKDSRGKGSSLLCLIASKHSLSLLLSFLEEENQERKRQRKASAGREGGRGVRQDLERTSQLAVEPASKRFDWFVRDRTSAILIINQLPAEFLTPAPAGRSCRADPSRGRRGRRGRLDHLGPPAVLTFFVSPRCSTFPTRGDHQRLLLAVGHDVPGWQRRRRQV